MLGCWDAESCCASTQGARLQGSIMLWYKVWQSWVSCISWGRMSPCPGHSLVGFMLVWMWSGQVLAPAWSTRQPTVMLYHFMKACGKMEACLPEHMPGCPHVHAREPALQQGQGVIRSWPSQGHGCLRVMAVIGPCLPQDHGCHRAMPVTGSWLSQGHGCRHGRWA